MTTPPTPPTRLHRNVYLLALTSFLTDVSTEMMSNLLPLFLVNVLGARTSVVGLIDGVAETTASLLKILSGQLSDRTGQRKPLAVFGYSLSTLVKPLLYFASSWGAVLGVRFADRVGKGLRGAPRDALLAGSVSKEQRGLAFGLHRAGDTAGAFTGLGIAALVIYLNQQGAAELTRATFQAVVLASIIPAILGVLVLALGVREVAAGPNAGKPGSFTGWAQLSPRFRRFLIVMVLFTLGNSSDSFLILRAQERGLNVLQIIAMLMTFNAVYTLLSGPAGHLSDRIGRRRVILTGWLVYGLIYLGFAFAGNGGQIWALFGVYGVYYAATEGVAKALVADFVPTAQHGAAYGYYNAAIGLTALPASLLAGVLWQGVGAWAGFGPSAPFLVGAVLALLAGLLLRFWVFQAD